MPSPASPADGSKFPVIDRKDVPAVSLHAGSVREAPPGAAGLPPVLLGRTARCVFRSCALT